MRVALLVALLALLGAPALGSTPTYTPKSIPGCVLWLDAADTSTITLGTGVSQWKDKCGSNNVSEATGLLQPTETTVNGRNALAFNGTSQYLAAATSTLPSGATPDWTAFAAVVYADDAANHVIFGWGTYDAGADMVALGIVSNTTGYYYTGSASWAAGIFEKATPQLIEWQSASTTVSNWQNGAAGTPSDGNNPTIPSTPPLYIGVFTNGTRQWWASDIMEIIVYNVALTTAQRQTIEGYLCWKWGFQADCAAYVTPYANASPFGWLIPFSLMPSAGVYPGGAP